MQKNKNSGKILLLKRSSQADFSPGIWEEITGRMHQFEDWPDALRREIKEEAGLEDMEIVKPLTVNHFFRGEKTAENEIMLIIFWCKTSSDRVVISNEHEDFCWVAGEEALKLVEHPGVKNDIEAYLREKAQALTV